MRPGSAPWQRRATGEGSGLEFGVEEEACVRPSEVEEPEPGTATKQSPVDGHGAARPQHHSSDPGAATESDARTEAQVVPSFDLDACTPTQSSCRKFLADTSCVADDAEISLQQVRFGTEHSISLSVDLAFPPLHPSPALGVSGSLCLLTSALCSRVRRRCPCCSKAATPCEASTTI